MFYIESRKASVWPCVHISSVVRTEISRKNVLAPISIVLWKTNALTCPTPGIAACLQNDERSPGCLLSWFWSLQYTMQVKRGWITPAHSHWVIHPSRSGCYKLESDLTKWCHILLNDRFYTNLVTDFTLIIANFTASHLKVFPAHNWVTVWGYMQSDI